MQWDTTFALPILPRDTDVVNTQAGNWQVDGNNVVTEWLPYWWTQMITQKDAITDVTVDPVIDVTKVDLDLNWTTSTQ